MTGLKHSKILKHLFTNGVLSILFFAIGSLDLVADTLTCAIPKETEPKSSQRFIKLEEAKTIIILDEANNVSKINSPGCNKFQSISRWTNNFIITCASNNAELIEIKVNMNDLKFQKTYSKNSEDYRSAEGFCKKSNF